MADLGRTALVKLRDHLWFQNPIAVEISDFGRLPMKTLVLSVFVSLALTMASLANASDTDTCGQLYSGYLEFKKYDEAGKGESNTAAWHYLGYIGGFVEGSMFADDGPDYPDRVSTGQVGYIIGKWLENHPERWHELRLVCAYHAVIKAFGKKR